jgi:hypothetical protein
VQEEERISPFIAYVDTDKEIAHRRAAQVSQLWQTSVIGMTVDEFKHALSHGSKLRKVLVNHLTLDSVRRAQRGSNVDIIPIEIYYSGQTIRALGKIKASSVLALLPNPAMASARFIVEQLHKWMKGKDRNIVWMDVNKVTDFTSLLNGSQYDRILVSPGSWNILPAEWRRNSRVLQLQMEFNPEALEIARIRAGVIV